MSRQSSPELRLGRRTRSDAVRLADALLVLERHPLETREGFRSPRPIGAALAGASPLLIPVLLGVSGVLSWRLTVLTATPLVVLSLARAATVFSDRSRSRTLADRLLRGYPGRPLSPLAAWRAEELTSPRTRKRLQRLVGGLIRETEASLSADLSPSELTGVRHGIDVLRALEARLGDLAEPVSPAGILAVSSLVAGEKWSPLYYSERAVEFADALDDVLATL